MENYKNLTTKQFVNTTDSSRKILEVIQKNNKMKKFIKEKLHIILDDLGISQYNWAIGGTAALMYYGINLNRGVGDIDIIIPRKGARKLLGEISCKARKSPFYKVSQDNSDYKYTHSAHIKLEVINGPAIDIVECDEDLDFTILYDEVELVPIEQILYLKSKWGRKKDQGDIKKIYNYLDSIMK